MNKKKKSIFKWRKDGPIYSFLSYIKSILRAILKIDNMIVSAHRPGHFYSPIVNPEELLDKQEALWPEHPNILGIDFNDEYHIKVLNDYFPKYIHQYNYAETQEEINFDHEFYTQNSQFSWLDSRILFVFLNEWKPKRMIEVGSGFSSLLTADVNHNFLDNSLEFKCIEPFPRDFLKKQVKGLSEVIISKVQDVCGDLFSQLESDDILFIDSSHVAKAGSDVNYLFFEVLPILKPGVKIHIHDIHLPHEYNKEWVIDENRSWNEQYLLRALLMYSNTFKIIFGSSYAQYKFPELVKKALNLPNGQIFGGGSLWIEKIK